MTQTAIQRRALFALVLGAACLVGTAGIPSHAQSAGTGGGGAAGDGGPSASPNYDLIAPVASRRGRPRPERPPVERSRERWEGNCQGDDDRKLCRPL